LVLARIFPQANPQFFKELHDVSFHGAIRESYLKHTSSKDRELKVTDKPTDGCLNAKSITKENKTQ
jgi:hypothetical protein